MDSTLKIFVISFAAILMVGCSTKKDAFVNRQYHAMSTKYNVLYNGNIAFKDGLEALSYNYEDNYWGILPIEPLKVDELALPGMVADPDSSPKEFEKAEEKAVKAIQKHSMLIARQERNSQIDEAYLLLGKSRYYSKRFVPSLEAFNYVIINYPNANLIDETRVWQSKANIRIENEDMAIETLNILLDKPNLSSDVKEAAHTTLAMAYVKTDSIEQVIHHLNQAVLTNNNIDQTARNLFILGQLYRAKNEIDSSDIAFQKVIDLSKAPYKYVIHAEIEQAKNVENDEEAVVMVEELQKLIKDRYNRAYLDELYFRLGDIASKDSVDLAIDYFKQSIQSSTSNNFQKEMTYEAIGNLYFDKAKFATAGAYYDSVLQISREDNSRRIRRLTRKRNNLDEVILYGSIAKINDSILNIVAMNDDERTSFFNKHIEKLKVEDERKELEALLNKTTSGSDFFKSDNSYDTNPSGKWYFYNNQTVGFGQQEFRKVWGNRPLEDNWRLSEKMSLNLDNQNNTAIAVAEIDQSKKYELSYYLENIPTNQTKIDSIAVERNEAYYNLGIIYQGQFKEVDLAISKLEKLLTFNPDENLSLPAKYHLYKMYSSLNSDKATSYKNDITTNYANSQYAKIILNPRDVLDKDNANSPESAYALVFYDYKEDKFESVIEQASEAIGIYDGLPIAPKFELLKAYAIGKKDGLEAFKEALEFVATNYPNTEEGKKASEVIDAIKAKI